MQSYCEPAYRTGQTPADPAPRGGSDLRAPGSIRGTYDQPWEIHEAAAMRARRPGRQLGRIRSARPRRLYDIEWSSYRVGHGPASCKRSCPMETIIRRQETRVGLM